MVENLVGRQCWGGWIGVCTGSLRLIALNQSSKRLRTCDLSSPKLKGRGDPRKLNEGGGDEEVVEGESSAKVLPSKNGAQGRAAQIPPPAKREPIHYLGTYKVCQDLYVTARKVTIKFSVMMNIIEMLLFE